MQKLNSLLENENDYKYDPNLSGTANLRLQNDHDIEAIYGKGIMDLSFSDFMHKTIKENKGVEPNLEDTIIKYENFMKMMTPKFGNQNLEGLESSANPYEDWKMSDKIPSETLHFEQAYLEHKKKKKSEKEATNDIKEQFSDDESDFGRGTLSEFNKLGNQIDQ